jgi:hypothetical protein
LRVFGRRGRERGFVRIEQSGCRLLTVADT